MSSKRFVARRSRTSRPTSGKGGGAQVFGIFYDDGSPSESWIHLPSFQRPRPLFLIKSPEGIAPVQEIVSDLNAGADFLAFPSLGHGTVPLNDFRPLGFAPGRFSFACLSTDRGSRTLELVNKSIDTPDLLNRAMEQGGRFSLSIVADPLGNSGGLYRPVFVFRTLPYRTNPEYLKYVLSAAIKLRNHLNASSGTEVLSIPFFFVDHIASKLDCIRVLESLTCRS